MIEKLVIENIEYEAIKYTGYNVPDIHAFIHCKMSQNADKKLSYFVRNGTSRGWNCANKGDYIVKAKETDVFFTYTNSKEANL